MGGEDGKLTPLPKHQTRGVRSAIRKAILGFVPPWATNLEEVQGTIEDAVDDATFWIVQCGWGPLDEEAFNALHGIDPESYIDEEGP